MDWIVKWIDPVNHSVHLTVGQTSEQMTEHIYVTQIEKVW